jgi:hypothetical protein
MLFTSLETFLTTLREEKEFKNFEMEAIKMCGSMSKKKKRFEKKKRNGNLCLMKVLKTTQNFMEGNHLLWKNTILVLIY